MTITAPTNGATVSGAVTISVTTTHAELVRFYAAGAEIATVSDAPYTTVWNSGLVANGAHTLSARAERGTETAVAEIGVTVNNLPGAVIVSVLPATATVELSATRQFTAQVTGTADGSVTWSLDENATYGVISASGLYTAPAAMPSPSNVTVRATSVAEPANSAVAVVTLVDGGGGEITVQVQPIPTPIVLGATYQCSAVVTGTDDTSVTWLVVEGAAHGSIDANGLYTAPATLPTPASATVRATSVADPSRDGTATVTLVAGQQSQAEENAIKESFATGYDVGELAEEGVKLAAEAVFGASSAAGGALTLTGTLTEQSPGGNWSYAESPSDRMIVEFSGGPTVTLVFTVFSGYLEGDWDDFVDQHQLDFTAAIDGSYNLRIQSQKEFTKSWDAAYTRHITGTVVTSAETVTLDVTQQGQEIDCYIEPPFAHYYIEEIYTGTISSPTANVVLDQSYWCSIMHNSSDSVFLKSTSLSSNSRVTLEGNTYQWDNVTVRWHAGSSLNDPGLYSVVIDSHQWVLQGRLLKNGALYGELQYDGPLVNESHGPELILHRTSGEDIWIHTLIQFP